jgi:hypothetical protein
MSDHAKSYIGQQARKALRQLVTVLVPEIEPCEENFALTDTRAMTFLRIFLLPNSCGFGMNNSLLF